MPLDDKTLHIIERVGIIKRCTSTIRDIFPNDLPYLWEKLSPFIEQIEETASSIKSIAKGG